MSTPRIAITAGDPCGIGPEVVLKALAAPAAPTHARLVVIGDLRVFEETARRLRRRLPRWRLAPSPDAPIFEDRVTFLDCGPRLRVVPGRSGRHAGAASLAYLNRGIALWRQGRLDAVVTAPVTKWAIGQVEPSFVGQTEYFARAMGVRDVVMMFVADRWRVVLLTRHVPLGQVSCRLTGSLLRTTIRLTSHALRDSFRIRRPRLALCGLNPHAGEEARCGQEEQQVFLPVLRALRRQGLVCDGPFAADGFFATHPERTYDAILCPYHDQGLIPFKMVARDRGCQLSVGLPIVRTSPDHGSALDIAGRGVAEAGSMRYALELAVKLATHRIAGARKSRLCSNWDISHFRSTKSLAKMRSVPGS